MVRKTERVLCFNKKSCRILVLQVLIFENEEI